MDKGRLLDDLKQAEGFRRTAYKDTKGFWTGGYGHFLIPQSSDWEGQSFDQDTIDNWLSADVDTAAASARSLVEWPSMDSDARQNALVELVFNMGLGTWKLFSLTRAALAHKQWQMAYNGLLDSRWAREVQPDGFTSAGRATRIASYLLNGAF